MIPDVQARLRTMPFANKVMKYALGSVVALATSVVVFAILDWRGVNTTVCSITAFVAGAVPNWVLNRRWAWQITGKLHFGREIVGYVVISVISLVAASAGTAATKTWADNHVMPGSGLRVLLVTGSYVLVQALLFVAKFYVYEKWVFAGRSRVRAAFRSRHQVWIAARANRTP